MLNKLILVLDKFTRPDSQIEGGIEEGRAFKCQEIFRTHHLKIQNLVYIIHINK